MNTLGEANVIGFFTTTVDRAIQHTLGPQQKYMKGNMSGKADTLFADFFLGVPLANVLIEFKDEESDKRHEKRKELRIKLCRNLTPEIRDLSITCHYIGWGINHDAGRFSVDFSEYVPDICSALGGTPVCLPQKRRINMGSFLQQLFQLNVGCGIADFVTYVDFLSSLAKDAGTATYDHSTVSFPAQLLSFSENFDVISTPIHTLADLEKAARILNEYQISFPEPSSESDDTPSVRSGFRC